MKRIIVITLVSLISGLSLSACGGGGGGSSSTTGTSKSGFDVPTEISAVPTNLSGSVGGLNGKPGLKSKLSAIKEAATDPGTDYSNAVTTKFVEEHTLEQFEIIEEILGALAQTKYSDPANVNQGPYKAMIAWQEERDGIETKSLQPWIVDSSMVVENGKEVNLVRVWVQEVTDGGMAQVIKAEFKIHASATKKADGSYQDYGVWKINAKFDDAGTSYFAADASIGANGETVLKIHENFSEGPFTHEVKAILNKSDTIGFGKVSFPDWESCMSPDCAPANKTAKYAYNASHLAVQKEGDVTPQFKDRSSITEMTHRYGMYDSVTGQDVLKTKSFGFPVQYTDSNGMPRFAYYGAWQGRHQLWADGGSIPAGTVVTRQDRGPNQTAETYTVSAPFVGTLTKRTPVNATLDDIKNIPVETWVHDHFELEFKDPGPSGPGWYKCQFQVDANGNPLPPTCNTLFTTFDTLIVGSGDNRKHVDINRWDSFANQPINYVYLASAPSGAGFYVANRDPNTGQLTPTTTKYTPVNGHRLWINIGGSIYIEFTGVTAKTTTGWVEKELINFDTRTWTPEFNPNGDKEYTLPLDREFYINSKGANYIVKRTSAGYDVKIEIQTTANPMNVVTFILANTVFKSQWQPDTDSTYEFVTNPASANFMKLVYKTIGQNDKDASGAAMPGVVVGAVVQKGQWGLVAHVNGAPTNDQYNWDYPREGDIWGIQQYLLNANSSYKLLDDPIRLAPITLANKAGVQKTLSLQYDGWMHGLPDLHEELRKNNFVITAAISDKIINIPAGTSVTDAQDSTKSYLIKPLEVSQFLNIAADPGNLNIGTADSIDLATVPVFVEHNMGPMPQISIVKYSEGILVQ